MKRAVHKEKRPKEVKMSSEQFRQFAQLIEQMKARLKPSVFAGKKVTTV
jgi:hypothetical protein